MSYPAKALAQHPGRNPDYRPYLLSIGPMGEIRRKASPLKGQRSMLGSQAYRQADEVASARMQAGQFRMGDWDKGRQE